MSRRGSSASESYGPDERIDLFLEAYEELRERPVIASGGLGYEFTIRGERGQPASFSFKEPDEEGLRSVLVTLRRFISPDDPVFLNRMHNDLYRELRSDPLRGRLVRSRDRWRQECERGPLAVVLNGARLRPEDVLDQWINGRYFHADKRKRGAIQALDPMETLLNRQVMWNLIVATIGYVVDVARVIFIARTEGLI